MRSIRIFAWACLAVVACMVSAAKLPAQSESVTPPEGRSNLASFFLILNSDSLLCMPCFERLIAFTRAVPGGLGPAGLWAVVLYDSPPPGMDETSYRVMIGRRAESVLRAHGCACPVVVDESRKWQSLSLEPAELLVLDGRARSVRIFPLPLASEDLALVQGIIKGEDHE
jgi:hypothetical protein